MKTGEKYAMWSHIYIHSPVGLQPKVPSGSDQEHAMQCLGVRTGREHSSALWAVALASVRAGNYTGQLGCAPERLY